MHILGAVAHEMPCTYAQHAHCTLTPGPTPLSKPALNKASIHQASEQVWFDAGSDALLEPGVYTLEDLRIFGRKQGWCPYFLARHMLTFANVVVYNYQYMLDPKVSKDHDPSIPLQRL